MDDRIGDLVPEEAAASIETSVTAFALVSGYLLDGQRTYRDLDAYVRSQAGRGDGRKFSKTQVAYLPRTPLPPGFWDYRCQNCRFYQPGDEDSDGAGRCGVVGKEDDPFGGERIHPNGWCSAWLPLDNVEAFDYLFGDSA